MKFVLFFMLTLVAFSHPELSPKDIGNLIRSNAKDGKAIFDIRMVAQHFMDTGVKKAPHNGLFIDLSRGVEMSLWQVLFLVNETTMTFSDFLYSEHGKSIPLNTVRFDNHAVTKGKFLFRWTKTLGE
jgi:hypothetical protein